MTTRTPIPEIAATTTRTLLPQGVVTTAIMDALAAAIGADALYPSRTKDTTQPPPPAA